MIVGILSLLGALCLFFWLLTSGETSEFGLNAFTETLGILITVVIVDYLLRRQEEIRALPQQAAAYEDVRTLTSRIVTFWSTVYRHSVPESMPETLDNFFCDDTFDKMRRFLNLDARPPVSPTRTWWEWLPDSLSDHRAKAEIILNRHNNILDPKAYAMVHQLATEGTDPSTIHALRKTDSEMGYPRIRVLGSYFFPMESYYKTVLGLVEWCLKQEALLKRNGLEDVQTVTNKLSNSEPSNPPPSMISEDELLKQIEAAESFQAASTKSS